MHQKEPEFDFNLSVDDVKTSAQRGAPDLAVATRERHATHRLPGCKSLGDDDAARPCRGPAHISALHQLQLTSNQPTSTPLPSHLIPVSDTRSHCSLTSSQESPEQLHQPRHDSILHYLKPFSHLVSLLRRSFERNLFFQDNHSGTNVCHETVHVVRKCGYHNDLQRVHKHKRCKKRSKSLWIIFEHRH